MSRLEKLLPNPKDRHGKDERFFKGAIVCKKTSGTCPGFHSQ